MATFFVFYVFFYLKSQESQRKKSCCHKATQPHR